MKGNMVVLAGMVVLCLGLVGTPASWANSITFQDVMFNLNDTGGNTLTLEINDVLSASGNWTGINELESFSLKGLGVTTLTLAGWSENGMELNTAGCAGGGSGGFCFTSPGGTGFALADDNTFVMNYTGTLDLDSNHLKVLFDGATGGNTHGDLLSRSVPVPGTFLMFGLGMTAFVGWLHRTKRGMPGLAA